MLRARSGTRIQAKVTSLQSYFFREILGPLVITIAVMGVLALLTQSLSSINLVINDRASLMAFLRIVSLTLPQLLSVIMPFAVFVAVIYAVQRMHTDNEIVVFYAGGMSQWAVISPVLRAVSLVVILNLVLNLFVQPVTFRAMREAIYKVRSNIVSSIVRPGEFAHPAPNLTIFAREMDNGVLKDVFIQDSRNPEDTFTLLAASGVVSKNTDKPSITLRNARRQKLNSDGTLTFLAFSSTRFELNGVIKPQGELVYKFSDRYLSELFHPDMADFWQQQNAKALYAEGHYRLSSPLYNFTFALMALAALLAGDFSKLGYGRRLMVFGALALLTRLLGFTVQAAAESMAWANWVQYLLPIGVSAVCMWLLFKNKQASKHNAAPQGAVA